jgi:sporulation protein YtfJ
MAENNVSEMIKGALEGIRTVADSGTVLGDPINTNNGTVIIPVSKVTVGFASGGIDYMPKGSDKDASAQKTAKPAAPCFGGGGGTGISVTPLCFLVVNAQGNVSILDLNAPSPAPAIVGAIDSASDFAQKVPDIIARIKNIFVKDEPIKDVDDEETEEDIEAVKEKVNAEVEKMLEKEAEKEAKKAEKVAKRAAKKAK